MAREEWHVVLPAGAPDGATSYRLTEGLVRDVEVRQGLYGTAASRGEDKPVGGRNGRLWQPKPLDAGSFALQIWLLAASRAELEGWYDELLRWTYSPWRLMLWRRTLADGSEREALGYVADSVAPAPIGQLGIRAGLAVTVPSGVWLQRYGGNTEVAGAVAGSDLAAFAGATAPMEELEVRLTGPGTDLSVRDQVTGQGFTYTGALADGEVVTVNSKTWQVTGGTVDRVVYDGPRFLTLHPRPAFGGTPRVLLDGAGRTAATKVRVAGQTAWLV